MNSQELLDKQRQKLIAIRVASLNRAGKRAYYSARKYGASEEQALANAIKASRRK
jgi:hypothetical protein